MEVVGFYSLPRIKHLHYNMLDMSVNIRKHGEGIVVGHVDHTDTQLWERIEGIRKDKGRREMIVVVSHFLLSPLPLSSTHSSLLLLNLFLPRLCGGPIARDLRRSWSCRWKSMKRLGIYTNTNTYVYTRTI